MPNSLRPQRTTRFNRAPRAWIAFPEDAVKVPDPPPLPNPPNKPHVIMLLLPALTMGLTAAGSVVVAMVSGNKAWWLGLLMLGGAVGTPLAQILVYRSSKKTWAKQVEEIERGFQSELADLQDWLAGLRQTLQERATELNPPASVLRERACQRHRRLWERRPRDEDFLHLRIGTHTGEPSYTIKFIESDRRDPRKRRANDIARPFARVEDLPYTFSLPALGSIGIAGRPGFRSALARTLVCNLAVHHSPAEVRLFLVGDARGQTPIGEWIKWLPHARPSEGDQIQIAHTAEAGDRLMKELLEELHRREQFLRSRDRPEAEACPYLVVLVEDLDLVRNTETINLMLQRGPELRAGAIFLAEDAGQIPGGCGARLETDSQTQARDGFVFTPDRPGEAVIRGTAELTTDVQQCEALARSLAPIQYAGKKSGELPGGISLSALFGAASARDLDLHALWEAHEDHTRQLTAPIGMAVGDRILELDLHPTAHGTHGLIAGTTRTGKTVLLSTVITALAVANSPRLLNLVILDLKGDPDLERVSRLPHVVGFASVLDETIRNDDARLRSYMTRAITALDSEIKRRMKVISAAAGPTEIFEYNRRHPEMPLPHLLVIIDEFGKLKKVAPEMMDELVQVAALGGAAGVHLILCTQAPSGIVSDKIWANAQFRICLRVANTEESRSVLKLPDAAYLPREPRGRAYLQVGENALFELFQVAYAGRRMGAESRMSAPVDEFKISEFRPDGTRPVLYSHSPIAAQISIESAQPTEMEYLVEHARQIALEAGLTLPLPGPWSSPLPETIPLESLVAQQPTHRRWTGDGWSKPNPAARLKVPLGMLDAPALQRQFPLVLDLARDHAHVWILGTLGSGKLLALRALVMALAQTHTPDEVHFYLLAFGGAGLKPLARLPHVGATIELMDVEHLQRLVTLIEQEVFARQAMLSRAEVDTAEEFRRATRQPMPAWVVVVDDFGKLVKEALQSPDLQEIMDRITKSLSFAMTADLHFVLSTTTLSLRQEIVANINGRLALRMQDKGEYSTVLNVRPPADLDEIPGRGFWRVGNEALVCQVATPANTPDDSQQAAMLSATADQMDRAWTSAGGARPRPVEVLPSRLPLETVLAPPAEDAWHRLPEQGSLQVPIGWDDDLQPRSLDLIREGPSFLIVGAPQSGKTGLLECLALSIGVLYNPDAVRLYGIDLKRDRLFRILGGLVNRCGVADSAVRAIQLLDELLNEIQARLNRANDIGDEGGAFGEKAPSGNWPRLFLFVDDFSRELSREPKENTDLMQRLDRCFDLGTRAGLHMIVAGDGATLASAVQPFMQRLKTAQRGFLFVKASDNAHLFSVKVPRLPPRHAIPGRAFYIQPTSTALVQLPCFDRAAEAENTAIKQWINQLRERAAVRGVSVSPGPEMDPS